MTKLINSWIKKRKVSYSRITFVSLILEEFLQIKNLQKNFLNFIIWYYQLWNFLIQPFLIYYFKLKIFIAFEQINITVSQNGSKQRDNCTENFIELYDGSTSLQNRIFHFCFSATNKIYKSQTNKLFIRYLLSKNSNKDYLSFRLVYNPFQTGMNSMWLCFII